MAGTQRTATTGAPFDVSASGGHPPLRREINDLIKDKVSFSIFIQALGEYGLRFASRSAPPLIIIVRHLTLPSNFHPHIRTFFMSYHVPIVRISSCPLFASCLTARMQKVSEQDDLSYYQLCGIHGLPYKAWQGAGGNSGVARTGYCTHSSNLFITWQYV